MHKRNIIKVILRYRIECYMYLDMYLKEGRFRANALSLLLFKFVLKRIAIDMDEVLAVFIPKDLSLYNQKFNEDSKVEELQGRKPGKL